MVDLIYGYTSFPVVLRDIGCDVFVEKFSLIWDIFARPRAIALGSKPPLVTDNANWPGNEALIRELEGMLSFSLTLRRRLTQWTNTFYCFIVLEHQYGRRDVMWIFAKGGLAFEQNQVKL